MTPLLCSFLTFCAVLALIAAGFALRPQRLESLPEYLDRVAGR